MENNNLEEKKNNNKHKYIIYILIFLWITSGIFGFIMSLICFFTNGNKLNNVIGLLISSIFFGPFYWIYYLYIDNYSGIKPLYKFIKK